MVRVTDRLDLTIVVDWDVKTINQTNKHTNVKIAKNDALMVLFCQDVPHYISHIVEMQHYRSM